MRVTITVTAVCLAVFGLLDVDVPLGSATAHAAVREPNADDDFTLREEMIPMRDGVTLHTLILTPKASKVPLPILFSRTP